MKVAILGNGPSLILDKGLYASFEKVVITNRLIWENLSEWDNQIIYVCADQRFGHSEEWTKAILRTTQEVFLSENLASNFTEDVSKNFIQSYRNLLSKPMAREFASLFPLMQDMNANVVLDFGILVALHFGATNICLFGCDFDYKLNKPSDKPHYFNGYKERGALFEHSVPSSINWSHQSQLKFSNMRDFLSTHNVKLTKNI
jgi:hypothetical protein